MGYELRALVGQSRALGAVAVAVGSSTVPLMRGLSLLPVTGEVFDRIGRGDERPFGEAFWFLSGGIAELAAQASFVSAIAYLEADLSGGYGTQVAVVWEGGQVALGPVKSDFAPANIPRSGATPSPVSGLRDGTESSWPDWPFNAALQWLGVDIPAEGDLFDAVHLGRYRYTEDWAEEAQDDPSPSTSA